jgi:restriction system protein
LSRRRESFLDMVTRSPWWVGVSLAVLVYVLSAYVLPTVTLSSPILSGIPAGVARVGPVVSLLLLMAAGFSAYHDFRKSKLLERQTGSESIGELRWQRFETLVGEVFRRKGYAVEANSADGPDGGVDLRLSKDGKTVFVQCKHWKARSVGVKVARELFGIMTAAGADHGVVVTYGDFTPEAREFAKANSIALIDGPKLTQMIASVQQSGNMKPAPAPAVQACPKCGSPMVLREARKGPHAGKKFRGCSKYPGCRGLNAARW